jgi:DNA end-binding protein Ku
MAKSILSLSIGFGSVSIPVRIYKAVEDSSPSFHQFHNEDKGRVKYQRVCTIDNKVLELSDIAKGKRFGSEIVLFQDDELDLMKPHSTKIMRIIGFYEPSKIPDIAYSEPLYVGTENKKGGGVGAAFVLLRDALRKSGKVAVVGWVARGHDHYGVLTPYGDIMLLRKLELAQNIRPPEEVEVLPGRVPPQLVAKAVSGIISRMTRKTFDWDKLRDSYIETLDKYIEKKALGEPVEIEEIIPQKPSELRDLEALLDQSAMALGR